MQKRCISKRGHPNLARRQELLSEQSNRCFYCGVSFDVLHVPYWDHFIPFSYSLNNSADNFVASCLECNCVKNDKFFDTKEEAIRYVKEQRVRKGRKVFDIPSKEECPTKEECPAIRKRYCIRPKDSRILKMREVQQVEGRKRERRKKIEERKRRTRLQRLRERIREEREWRQASKWRASLEWQRKTELQQTNLPNEKRAARRQQYREFKRKRIRRCREQIKRLICTPGLVGFAQSGPGVDQPGFLT